MNKILLTSVLFFLLMNAFAQNVGINNTDPKAALDVNGGFRLRSENATVSGTSVTLNSNRSHHVLIGSPTGDFNITFIGATETGQHAIITNTTLYKGLLVPIYIQPNTTVELIYSNGAWKLIGTNEAISTTAWSRTGNGGTIDGVNNLFGTTDAKPIRFIENSLPSGYMDAGRANYFFGGAAGTNMQASAQGNTGVGYFAMFKNTTGIYNVAIGSENLQNNQQGSFITSLGVGALNRDTAANETVAIGAQALYYNQARFGNTAVGTNALYWNTFTNTSPILASQGLHNTALGHNSLLNNRRGSGGVAIGFQAAYSDTASDGIVAIGRSALELSNGKKGVLAIGDSALFSNGIGATGLLQATNNLAIGAKTLKSNTTGYDNIAIGKHSLVNNTVGIGNIALGTAALVNNVGNDYNIAIGDSSLFYAGITTIPEPVLVKGVNNNIVMGKNALYHASKSERNVAIGNHSNYDGVWADHNVSIGDSAMYANYHGDYNVAIGSKSMTGGSVNWGSGNVALGYGALYNNDGASTPASFNTAIGFRAGYNNDEKRYNVFLGTFAGYNNKGSNKLYIESSQDLLKDSTTSLIYGDFAADSLLLNAKTVVRNNAVVRGFTKLGGYDSDVPSVKMKELSVTSSVVANGQSAINHGLSSSKIISISTLMEWTPGFFAPTEYSPDPLLRYNYFISPTQIIIQNNAANCTYICSKPVKILITYKE